LIAGGIAAAFMDKSGKAGDAFSSGFNKQLDRNLVGQKMKATQAQKEVENKLNMYKIGQTDRKIEIDQRGAENDEKRTAGVLGNYQTQAELGRERNAISRAGVSATAANAEATQGLRRQQMDLNQELFNLRKTDSDRNYELNKEKVGILGAKADAAGGVKAPDFSSTAANEMVKRVADEAGTSLSKGAQAAVAEQVRILQKADPVGFASDPTGVVRKAIAAGANSKRLKKTGNTDYWNNVKYEVAN